MSLCNLNTEMIWNKGFPLEALGLIPIEKKAKCLIIGNNGFCKRLSISRLKDESLWQKVISGTLAVRLILGFGNSRVNIEREVWLDILLL